MKHQHQYLNNHNLNNHTNHLNNYINPNSILDSMPCIFILKDQASNYIYFNQDALKAAKLSSKDEILGRKDNEMAWREFSDRYVEQDKRVLRGESLFNIDPTVCCDGSKILLLTKKAPVYSDSGKIVAVSGVSLELNRDKFSDILVSLGANGLNFSDFLFSCKDRNHQFSYENVEFSTRQAQVIGCLLRGHSAESASTALNLSKRTIETHIENIKNILNYNKKNELINLAFEKGFIELMFLR